MSSAKLGLEGRINGPLATWSELASLIASGTLERYPSLIFAFFEAGFSWLELFLERADAAGRAFADRLPELGSSATEAVRRQIRFSTQPFDDDRDDAAVAESIEASDLLADVLVYGSNRPKGAGSPGLLHALPEATRLKIGAENARSAFRL
jgi:hypothetical protein